jgi:hypothetical protein
MRGLLRLLQNYFIIITGPPYSYAQLYCVLPPPATAQYSCIGRDNPPETGYESSALFIMPYSPLTAASTLALNSITSVTHCYM